MTAVQIFCIILLYTELANTAFLYDEYLYSRGGLRDDSKLNNKYVKRYQDYFSQEKISMCFELRIKKFIKSYSSYLHNYISVFHTPLFLHSEDYFYNTFVTGKSMKMLLLLLVVY